METVKKPAVPDEGNYFRQVSISTCVLAIVLAIFRLIYMAKSRGFLALEELMVLCSMVSSRVQTQKLHS